MSVVPDSTRSNGNSPKYRFRLVWRKSHWRLTSSSQYQKFPTLQEALDYVRHLQRNGGLLGRLEECDPGTGKWREVPELARLWAEGGWSK